MEALPRETTVDVLESRLREDILAGRHPAGSHLPPERRLADGYGVTRTTLKHACGRHVQAGLLETRHGVGPRVRDCLRWAEPICCPCSYGTAPTGSARSSKYGAASER
ncbi:winged helix-turn-helix domain-containing protein [Streptomyces sp. NPDC054834]